ncbi:fatty acyl-CoA reductase 1-like isoform X1 [Anoplophora glabripennis]|uniref:fatty acyl-CoA reductase 1-like isoform X1 n=1 Tax=Anoplophora glabripennis TaxID=217634 RepID=UPI000C786361|nr:fatty acyl-CoA reductase 1-like isoform X1 [Anoplophora glabripennis]
MSVGDFFNGKYILITGGSGFIGKVLIEKLLRSCGGIEKIYVLLRKKKDKTPEERLQVITDYQLFDSLKKINPEAIKKLVPICGDLAKPKLGLTEEDTQTLIENVDIIYHGAASVRFDDHLRDAVLLNTRATKEVVDIALQAKKLITFVHISTAYCNCDKFEIEEKIYPAHADWKSTITLAEQVDQHTLSILSPKYIYPLPNTYTFAKSLSEHVVNDLCKGKLLATIVRPSIVVPSLDEPIPGWIENFNGPVGLLCGGGKGVLQTCYGEENSTFDWIPVDILTKLLILITYEKALSNDPDEIPVYNTAAGEKTALTYKELMDYGRKSIWDAPYTNLLWYPSGGMINSLYKFYAYFLLYHMIPALVADGLLKAFGKETMILKIQRKLFLASTALSHFMRNSWKFKNAKVKALQKHVDEDRTQTFSFGHYFELNSDSTYAFWRQAKISSSKLLFDEEYNIEKGIRNTMIFWILNMVLHVTVFGVLLWYLISKIEIITVVNNMINSYLVYFSEL